MKMTAARHRIHRYVNPRRRFVFFVFIRWLIIFLAYHSVFLTIDVNFAGIRQPLRPSRHRDGATQCELIFHKDWLGGKHRAGNVNRFAFRHDDDIAWANKWISAVVAKFSELEGFHLAINRRTSLDHYLAGLRAHLGLSMNNLDRSAG